MSFDLKTLSRLPARRSSSSGRHRRRLRKEGRAAAAATRDSAPDFGLPGSPAGRSDPFRHGLSVGDDRRPDARRRRFGGALPVGETVVGRRGAGRSGARIRDRGGGLANAPRAPNWAVPRWVIVYNSGCRSSRSCPRSRRRITSPFERSRATRRRAFRTSSSSSRWRRLKRRRTCAPPPPRTPWSSAGTGPEEAVGFEVYRRLAQEKGYGTPLARIQSKDETSYRDRTAAYGTRYIYTVRALGNLDPPIISAPAGEREVDYRDVFPPSLPRSFVALGERSRARLRWRASTAKDVAGYILFRREPGTRLPSHHRRARHGQRVHRPRSRYGFFLRLQDPGRRPVGQRERGLGIRSKSRRDNHATLCQDALWNTPQIPDDAEPGTTPARCSYEMSISHQ